MKVYFYNWIRHIPTPKLCTEISLSHLLPHNPVFITIPVVRAAFIASLKDPAVIILVHLTITGLFFIVFIVNKICAGAAYVVHHLCLQNLNNLTQVPGKGDSLQAFF